MSAFFFCAACGHNLTGITYLRLKCYGCGKMFAFSFNDEAICHHCRREYALKYSIEILTPQKGKCLCCGQEKRITRSLEPPYRDKYMGGGGTGGLGSWDGQVRARKEKRPKPKAQTIEKPEVDYVSEDQIIIRFPGHSSLDQIRCEIVNGFLEVQSLLVDFSEKFPLPDFPAELKTDFKNAILNICLERKAKGKTNK